ncbi:hypothetical protein CDAR_196821 [Caerostris darwini]|uniref:Uncharacterized protein n=1 Tax=Caerostris darwini TaxID=1538125 RepID=A0AAV4PWJ1_9ARAC|nr:hypothetical protein CDAR_196821 [Caerostris darwini]
MMVAHIKIMFSSVCIVNWDSMLHLIKNAFRKKSSQDGESKVKKSRRTSTFLGWLNMYTYLLCLMIILLITHVLNLLKDVIFMLCKTAKTSFIRVTRNILLLLIDFLESLHINLDCKNMRICNELESTCTQTSTSITDLASEINLFAQQENSNYLDLLFKLWEVSTGCFTFIFIKICLEIMSMMEHVVIQINSCVINLFFNRTS